MSLGLSFEIEELLAHLLRVLVVLRLLKHVAHEEGLVEGLVACYHCFSYLGHLEAWRRLVFGRCRRILYLMYRPC